MSQVPVSVGLPHSEYWRTKDVLSTRSTCGSPTDTGTWRIGVLRDPQSRGGSDFVHDKLHVGSSVRVRGPRNHFPLVSAPRYQFIAGGVRITPLLPMIEAPAAPAPPCPRAPPRPHPTPAA